MQYKKLENNGYNLHIIKTKRFKNIQIRFNLKRPIKKEEITIRNILNDILINTTKKYPTIRDIEIKTEDLYNFGANSSCYKSGNYSIMSFSCNFLNEKYTEEGMLEQSISFFLDFIFDPNVKENKFETAPFIYTKEYLKNDIESIKDDPRRYSLIRLREEMDPESPISYRGNGYIEDLDKITEENLYKYYLDVLKNDVIDIFVLGDVDTEEVQSIIEKYMPKNRKQPSYNIEHCITNEQTRNEINEVEETENFNQSKLSVGIKVYDMDDYEKKYTLNALTFILGGSGDSKLFKKLREENSLCYYVSCSPSMLSSDMVITSGIDSNDYEKAVDLIKECIEEIQNGNVSKEDVEQEINVYLNSCLEIYDSPASIINSYLSHEYLGNDVIEEKLKKAKEMTPDKIIELAKKIKIDTIYLLKGGATDAESSTN